MYNSSTHSARQSRESLHSAHGGSNGNSSSSGGSGLGDVFNSRLIPRGTHIGDEELVFRNDSGRSKLAQNHQYMNSISTGQKARNTLNASHSRTNSLTGSNGYPTSSSTSNSAVSLNMQHRPGQPSPSGTFSKSASQAGSASVGRSSSGQIQPMLAAGNSSKPHLAQGSQPTRVQIDARGFLKALNELFFSKFCVDELFYREFREQLVRRVQESTYRYDLEDLRDILDDISDACKSTRLNLDAVAQWQLNFFTREQVATVIDHVFLINANVMAYDPKYSSQCLDIYCADPLCSEIHTGRVTEEDKAKAFRRTLNVVLNEALRIRLITKEQKITVRARLVKGIFSSEDRINTLRELAVLILLGQDERYRDLVIYAVTNYGKAWTPSDAPMTEVEEDCNLDPDMVYRKALSSIGNTYLESILNVRRLGMNISLEEVGKLRTLWANTSTRAQDAKVLTLPMLLHLLVHCSESELQGALPQAGISAAALAKSAGAGQSHFADSTSGALGARIEQVEDAALQIVQNLGLAWELGDNPPRDLRQFCMVLLLDLGSVLSKFLVEELPAVSRSSRAASRSSSTSDLSGATGDAREIGVVEDGLFTKWWDVCNSVVRFERAHRRFHVAFLVTYIKISSEKLLAQKSDFDPEMFLSIVADLLTEYRKRRPDYEAIILTPDGRLSASAIESAVVGGGGEGGNGAAAKSSGSSGNIGGSARSLDKRTRENIGAEFDRLFAWVDQQLPASNRVRSLTRATSPRARTGSWQINPSTMDKMRSSSSASVGYNSTNSGSRVASPLPPMPHVAHQR